MSEITQHTFKPYEAALQVDPDWYAKLYTRQTGRSTTDTAQSVPAAGRQTQAVHTWDNIWSPEKPVASTTTTSAVGSQALYGVVSTPENTKLAATEGTL